MQQSLQTDPTCNIQQCWVRLYGAFIFMAILSKKDLKSKLCFADKRKKFGFWLIHISNYISSVSIALCCHYSDDLLHYDRDEQEEFLYFNCNELL